MADNVDVTPGTGATIATDDVGGVQYQRVKVDVGGDGLASPLVRGQQTGANSIPVVLPSDQAAIPVTDNSGSLTVDYATTGSGTATGALRVELPTNGTGVIATVGAVTAITNALPAGTNAIGKLAANSGVDIGDVDVTSVPTDPFGANADAASATGSISAKLRFIASTGIPITGTVTVGSHAVTNAGTFPVQVDGAALTALQLIDDPVVTLGTGTYSEATSKGNVIAAVRRDADTTLVDTTNEFGPLQMDANGRLKVEVFDSGDSHTVDNGGTFAVQVDGNALTALQLIDDIVYTDDTSTHSTGSSKGALFMAAATPTDGSVNANDIGAVAMTVDRKLHVAVMDALPAGTNGIGKLTSNAGVTIGAVEIAAAQTLATVTTVSTLTGGGVAHDSGDSGNPVKVGAKAITALSGATLVASADRTDNQSDLDGALLVRENGTLADYVNGNASNTDGSSTQVLAAGAAGVKHYITDVTIANTSASNIYVELKDNTTVKWTFPVPANGGVTHSFKTPLAGTAATAWNFDPSSAATTVYCSVAGFKSKI
jgi:hypothetical protein